MKQLTNIRPVYASPPLGSDCLWDQLANHNRKLFPWGQSGPNVKVTTSPSPALFSTKFIRHKDNLIFTSYINSNMLG
jgi:hypothetical protein